MTLPEHPTAYHGMRPTPARLETIRDHLRTALTVATDPQSRFAPATSQSGHPESEPTLASPDGETMLRIDRYEGEDDSGEFLPVVKLTIERRGRRGADLRIRGTDSTLAVDQKLEPNAHGDTSEERFLRISAIAFSRGFLAHAEAAAASGDAEGRSRAMRHRRILRAGAETLSRDLPPGASLHMRSCTGWCFSMPYAHADDQALETPEIADLDVLAVLDRHPLAELSFRPLATTDRILLAPSDHVVAVPDDPVTLMRRVRPIARQIAFLRSLS